MPLGNDSLHDGSAGTSKAIDQLLEARSAFRDFIKRRVPDLEIADDLLQQSLTKALQRVHTLKNDDSVVAWFYRLLRHAIIDYYRSHAAEDRKNDAFLNDLLTSERDKEPSLDDVRPEVCACMSRLLPALRSNYADLIRRVDLAGESIQAVAQELHTTPNNLTVRLHRARQALRASLEKSCGVCTKHGCLNCTCEPPPA